VLIISKFHIPLEGELPVLSFWTSTGLATLVRKKKEKLEKKR